MTWTYTGNPGSSERDELRFLIQDVFPERPLLTDEELDWLLLEWMPKYDSVSYVGAVACGVITRKFAGIVSVMVDGVSVQTGDLSNRYQQMQADLREEYRAAQGVGVEIDLSNIMVCSDADDEDILPLMFGLGMHDNLEAGQQDYGGRQTRTTGIPAVQDVAVP